MKHKLVVYPLVVIFVLAAGLVGVWYWIGMAGTSPVERWIGEQVKSIARTYLNPTAEFDELDYQKPYTVVLTKFRLTVNDPDNSGKTLDVIHVDKLRLELAEIPTQGKPILIKKLILDHPKINAIAARRDGKFMGFQNMLKETKPSATEPAQGGTPRLSDVFQIVLLEIIEGQVVYESRASGQPPMILDAINSRMDVQKDAQGWYKLAAKLDRKPVVGLIASGRLDLDNLVLMLDSLNLDIDLSQKQYSSLPGSIQQMLKEHEVTGSLKLTASGRLPLGDAAASDLAATLSVDKAHFAAGQYKGEAQNVSSKLLLKDRRVVLDHLDADTLRGKVHLTAELALGDPFDGRVHLTASDIRIEDTLRAAAGGAGGEPKYKGVVNADVTLTGPMNNILTRAGGSGWLKLRDGHLVSLRVVADIGQALAQKISSILSGQKESRQDSDSADLEFQFVGDKVHFTKIFAQTSSFAINGHGDVWFDKRLDLLLNGGPAGTLQSALAGGGEPAGPAGGGIPVVSAVGNLLNAVGHKATGIATGVVSQAATDVLNQVATVVVGGTTDEPQVRIEAFRQIRDTLGGK
jgi:hypothetical protein